MSDDNAHIQQVAVIGLGRFGLAVARTLVAEGYEVLGIDASEEAVQRSVNVVTHAMQAVVFDAARVLELGLNLVDAAVIAMGTDVEANIVGTALLVEAGVPYVIARANSALHGTILTRVGAHQIVYPEVTSGEEIARSLRAPNSVGYIALDHGAGIHAMPALSEWIGQQLSDLHLSAFDQVTVLALQRAGKMMPTPPAETRIQEGDLAIVLTPYASTRSSSRTGVSRLRRRK